jgi:hypothetical protein
MKAITQAQLEQHMIGRAVIDRKRNISASLLIEQRAINKEFKTRLSASMLYTHYISICQTTTWDLMADKKIGIQLGYSTRSISEMRRKLQKAGWINFVKHMHDGVEYGIWYIGKDVVKASLSSKTSLIELANLGIITDEEYEAQKDLEVDIPTTDELYERAIEEEKEIVEH